MANTYLTKTFGSAGNRKTWTWSAWVKPSNTATDQGLWYAEPDATGYTSIRFASNKIRVLTVIGGSTANGFDKVTTRLFRDTSAWYHFVVAYDSTQATANDRVKIYVNGVLETAFDTNGFGGGQNLDSYINAALVHQIGAEDNVAYYNGSMSHIHFIDGTAYDASDFGEYDTNGVWKIKTSPSVTYGTNGFFILKDGNSVTDQSPNTNNFTVGGGTLTNTEDNPSNVFATLNPLVNVPTGTYSNGNTQFNGGAEHRTGYGTLAFSTGKYYWEAKATGGTKYTIGLSDAENQSAYQQVSGANLIVGSNSNSYLKGDAIGWYYTTLYKNGSTVASSIHQIATNDIMMIACDADSGKIYYGVNGTWRVANSTTFNASSNDTTFTTGRFYVPACSNENCGWQFNFGNGYFGTTAVSSAGTNASGIGIFEYDVPTGYTALSTKGLNL